MSAAVQPLQVQRYRILSELGRGSMGRVYLADDPNIERRIALKVLKPERLGGAAGEEMRRRFLQEARAAGGLSHRGIVTIYDADTDPESGCPYLAMEWVRGCSLKALLRRDGPPGPARAVSMAAQVARALDYAHRHKVVHRDVKPANLLVTGEDTIKVVDFGIAKLLSKSLTQPGRVLGSPYYMAPEQVRGLRVDGRADLFSLGAVLYEMLTGRVAFGGETVAAVSHKILAVNPRPIDNPEVLPSLRAVIRRALEKLPRDRYRSGAELAAALETVGAELALGHRTGMVSVPLDGSGTTTEVMRLRDSDALTSEQGSSPDDVGTAPVTGGWRWPRALALVALVLILGVLLGRSLAPQIFVVADPGGEAVAGPATSAEDAAPPVAPPSRPAPPFPAVTDRPVAQEGRPETFTVELLEFELLEFEPLEEAEAVATTNLEIIYQNRLKLAYFSVWLDGRRALLAELETKGVFQRLKGREHRWLIPVPAGERALEIRVSSPAKELDARNEIRRVFSEEDPQRLTVGLWPDSGQLGFQWESLPAAEITVETGDELHVSRIQ